MASASRRLALSVIHLWPAPQVVREYLETGDESLRASAWDAMWSFYCRGVPGDHMAICAAGRAIETGEDPQRQVVQTLADAAAAQIAALAA